MLCSEGLSLQTRNSATKLSAIPVQIWLAAVSFVDPARPGVLGSEARGPVNLGICLQICSVGLGLYGGPWYLALGRPWHVEAL